MTDTFSKMTNAAEIRKELAEAGIKTAEDLEREVNKRLSPCPYCGAAREVRFCLETCGTYIICTRERLHSSIRSKGIPELIAAMNERPSEIRASEVDEEMKIFDWDDLYGYYRELAKTSLANIPECNRYRYCAKCGRKLAPSEVAFDESTLSLCGYHMQRLIDRWQCQDCGTTNWLNFAGRKCILCYAIAQGLME